jgi:hypothetical protein
MVTFWPSEAPRLIGRGQGGTCRSKEKEVNEQGEQASEKHILPHHHAVTALFSHVDPHYTFYPLP